MPAGSMPVHPWTVSVLRTLEAEHMKIDSNPIEHTYNRAIYGTG